MYIADGGEVKCDAIVIVSVCPGTNAGPCHNARLLFPLHSFGWLPNEINTRDRIGIEKSSAWHVAIEKIEDSGGGTMTRRVPAFATTVVFDVAPTASWSGSPL
jgi:hypothetical protein